MFKILQIKEQSTLHKQLLGHEVPPTPWSKVATDIFHYESQPYLLIVDYTSRFPVVRKLKSMSAAKCCRALQIYILGIWMARHSGE